jgi:hypothetical protein
MSGASADGPVEVAVTPRNDRYDPDDGGRPEQVAAVYANRDAPVDTAHCVYPTRGAKGAADQLIIAVGSAAVLVRWWVAYVPGWDGAGWDGTGTGVSSVSRCPSSMSELNRRDHLDDQGRSRRQEDGKNLTFRFGSLGSRIASVPTCNLMR